MRYFLSLALVLATSTVAAAGPQVHPFRAMDGKVMLHEHGDGCYLACYSAQGLEDLRRGPGIYLVGLLKVNGNYLDLRGRAPKRPLCHPFVCVTTASGPSSSSASCQYQEEVADLPEMDAMCAKAFDAPALPGRHYWAGGDTQHLGVVLTDKVVDLESAHR